jgi:hypothetical protein
VTFKGESPANRWRDAELTDLPDGNDRHGRLARFELHLVTSLRVLLRKFGVKVAFEVLGN